MTPDEAVVLVAGWPENRDAPRALKRAYDAARGVAKREIGSLVESLFAGAKTDGDLALIDKYWP